MAKLVKIALLDEATKQPTGEFEEVMMNDAIENLVRLGAILSDEDGIFFQRQLEYIQAQTYDILYPELMGRQVFALNTEGGEGIETLTYRSYDKRGEVQIIAGKATDLPRADIDGKEYTISVRTLGGAYGYSRQEIAAAKITGMPLEQRKAEAVRKAYEEKVNQIIWFGSPENNLHGFFDGPVGAPCLTVSKTAVADGAGGDKGWGSTKTPDEVIKDLTDAVNKMYIETKKIFKPNQILISPAKKLYLMNTPRTNTSDVSIMNWFLQNNQFITSHEQFKDCNELVGIYDQAGGDFAADGSKGEGFTVLDNSAENMRVRETFPLMHLPVQYKGLEFEINCYGRFAGMEMVRPAAVQHFYGI